LRPLKKQSKEVEKLKSTKSKDENEVNQPNYIIIPMLLHEAKRNMTFVKEVLTFSYLWLV